MNPTVRLFAALSLLVVVSACRKQVPQDGSPLRGGPEVVAPPEIPTPAQQIARNFERVGFEFDSSNLTSEAGKALDDNARIMAAYSDVRVQVQGHCDERGTTDYNLSLGERRAAAVKKYLVNAGVAPSRVDTISYGEERPLAAGEGEYVWAQNRRAEFLVTDGSPGEVVGTTR